MLLDGTDNLEKALRWMNQPKGRNCTNPVLVTSYEYLRTLGESQPSFCNVEIGLLLCDEGHRLKNTGKHLNIIWTAVVDVHTQSPRLGKCCPC